MFDTTGADLSTESAVVGPYRAGAAGVGVVDAYVVVGGGAGARHLRMVDGWRSSGERRAAAAAEKASLVVQVVLHEPAVAARLVAGRQVPGRNDAADWLLLHQAERRRRLARPSHTTLALQHCTP